MAVNRIWIVDELERVIGGDYGDKSIGELLVFIRQLPAKQVADITQDNSCFAWIVAGHQLTDRDIELIVDQADDDIDEGKLKTRLNSLTDDQIVELLQERTNPIVDALIYVVGRKSKDFL